MVEANRTQRHHRDAVLVDQKRIFVRAVDRAAILDDAQPSGADLVDDPVIQKDHTVRNILFEPLAGKARWPSFCRDDGCDPTVFEPPK